MLVSPDHKFVYMNIGKTGSITLGEVLKKHFGAYVWVKHHPSVYRIPPRSAYQHCCHLPEKFADFFIITSVRNPFTHELSRFTHGNERTITMQEFDKWIKRGWMETFHHKLNMMPHYKVPIGCTRYKVDYVIRLENIEEDFNNLPFVTDHVPIPHRNKAKNDQQKLFYTDELADIVRSKRAIDFELFNYSTELPRELQRIKCL